MLVEIHRAVERDRYCQRLNRRVRGSLNHLREIVRLLEMYGLIKVMPAGKINRIKLTDKGKRVTTCILKMKSELR